MPPSAPDEVTTKTSSASSPSTQTSSSSATEARATPLSSAGDAHSTEDELDGSEESSRERSSLRWQSHLRGFPLRSRVTGDTRKCLSECGRLLGTRIQPSLLRLSFNPVLPSLSSSLSDLLPTKAPILVLSSTPESNEVSMEHPSSTTSFKVGCSFTEDNCSLHSSLDPDKSSFDNRTMLEGIRCRSLRLFPPSRTSFNLVRSESAGTEVVTGSRRRFSLRSSVVKVIARGLSVCSDTKSRPQKLKFKLFNDLKPISIELDYPSSGFNYIILPERKEGIFGNGGS